MKINKHSGFSMLEIMVAITISLILLLGILQIFVSNKNTYRLQNNLAILQENGRFLHEYLRIVIRNTAFRSSVQNQHFAALEDIFGASGGFISGTRTGTNGSDVLIVRFQGSGTGSGVPDNTIRDCLNRGVDAFTIATNTISLNANNQLTCRAQNANGTPTDDTQVILDDVENFQVLYGEDLNNDKTPDRFVSANYPSLNFNNVVAVKLAILLRSTEQNNPVADSKTYNLLGTLHTAGGDRFSRQTLSFTIMLRNAVTEVAL
ncbi:MAG: PilW family protein [Candidatus Berkiella sp.]